MNQKLSRNFLLGASTAALVLGSVLSAAAADKASEKFITEAIQGNLAEVQIGELAQKNGKSDAVKDFGKTLVTDHSAAKDKAVAAAKDLGVTAPTAPSAKQKADYDKMSKLTGDQFDKTFAKEMVADHKKDIAEYKSEAKKKDPAGNYASDALPTLQKHLDLAQKLESGSASTTGSGGSSGGMSK